MGSQLMPMIPALQQCCRGRWSQAGRSALKHQALGAEQVHCKDRGSLLLDIMAALTDLELQVSREGIHKGKEEKEREHTMTYIGSARGLWPVCSAGSI